MRRVWQVVYIIYATILILVVGTLSIRRQEDVYFESEGAKALASSNEMEKFYFFYGSLGYHLKTPTIIEENEEFTVAFFEVYREEIESSIFYVMLYPNPEKFSDEERVLYQMAFNFGDNETKTYEFDRFRNLPIYVLVNIDRHAEIPINEIHQLAPNSYTVIKKYAVIDEENESIFTQEDKFSFSYNVSEEDFIVSNTIKTIGVKPDLLAEEDIFPKHQHLMTGFRYIFYLSVGAALIIVVLGAYFLFYFRRGQKSILGRKETTPAFKKFGPKKDYEDPLDD